MRVCSECHFVTRISESQVGNFCANTAQKTPGHSGLLATARDFDSIRYSALSVAHISRQIYAVVPESLLTTARQTHSG